ncbi:MAG: hypothetical protein FWC16_09385 [Defluviitaleaceae bacterium]|nr:hypothetical protein [Defluviitaleaceae bacterium]MCL2275124.1 hypothetical protein [Defluviitaleaceae bacterium]
MKNEIKKRLLCAINNVVLLNNYEEADCIFSQKYNISPTDMVYILKQLEKDFNFKITDDFIDSLEMCTFAQLEKLLEEYSDKQYA